MAWELGTTTPEIQREQYEISDSENEATLVTHVTHVYIPYGSNWLL